MSSQQATQVIAAGTPTFEIRPRQRYHEKLHNVPKVMSNLMSSYSGIPKNEQVTHITKVRNEAYAQFPYPCMGTFRFLDLDLARHEAYKEHVLNPLCQPTAPGKPEPLFLDCGCCLGQELRKLAVDGAPPHRLWASDIEPRFIELGFELFRDWDKLPRDHFLCPGNVLVDTKDPSEDQLTILNDKVTILNISAVFHLFDLDDHKRVANRCLRLLRKDTNAPVLILGAHAGSPKPERRQYRPGTEGERCIFSHNEESWEALWREVCEQPQWKDKVAALEVKAKMFGRVRNEDPDADEVITLCDPGVTSETSEARPWQMWEIWVTFTPGS
ncbi:hypothetical protein E0Z10_g10344 [Xylaria hypoxylon]|uniref:Methyltransferase domain-containing protein n=1 Tax=Xylaria hypoxylon TaxID=37992 RepID=A0A4Z0YHL8_9PEZI|nr:hypothetical protein E0Z10_g10344 [Xylaria hypoxylon]